MASKRPVDRRAMRKRGLLRLVDQEIAEASAQVDRTTARRLRGINAVGAPAFVLAGGQRGGGDRFRPGRVSVRDRRRAGAGRGYADALLLPLPRRRNLLLHRRL